MANPILRGKHPKTLLEVFSEEIKEMEFRHEGMVITVSPDGYFVRETGEINALGALKVDKYATLAKAKESIDMEIAAARKSKDNEANVTLLDDRGRTMTLRRVHENTGEWLTGKGEQGKPYSGYLPLDAARELLEQRQQLREQVRELDASLTSYAVDIPQGHGKQRPDSVDRLVERLHEAVTKAQEKVDALSKPVEA